MPDHRRKVLVTGGAGFVGSHLVDLMLAEGHEVTVLDRLTHASNLKNIEMAQSHADFQFICGDIRNITLVSRILDEYRIDWVVHLAAESHVNSSIAALDRFIETNVTGTGRLLSAALEHWRGRNCDAKFRFLQVSTDQVFGQLPGGEAPISESSAYQPNSPYAATKAGGDHLASAWHATYGLPVIITHCGDNFGPRQYRTNFVPTILHSALRSLPIPMFGEGKNIRDWLYVEDHCHGLLAAAIRGVPGDRYCFGGETEWTNLALAELICTILDDLAPRADGQSYRDQISFFTDRKPQKFHYAIDNNHATNTLNWAVGRNFDTQLMATIVDHLENRTDTPPVSEMVDLEQAKHIDFANTNLGFDDFRALANNPNLRPNAKIAFPEGYRDGFSGAILDDIAEKLPALNESNRLIVDIGCGCGDLTKTLVEYCSKQSHRLILVDSEEMLNQIPTKEVVRKIPGRFPDVLPILLAQAGDGADAVLSYSVIQYVAAEMNVIDFLDALLKLLAPGGRLLIGDIPNADKRERFFASPAGIAYHKEHMKSEDPPPLGFNRSAYGLIDDMTIADMMKYARTVGFDSYALPQANNLPMANRREDLLFIRP